MPAAVAENTDKPLAGTLSFYIETYEPAFDLQCREIGAGKFVDTVETAAVDVPEREIVKQVAESRDPQFRRKHFRPRVAHSFQEFYVGIKKQEFLF